MIRAQFQFLITEKSDIVKAVSTLVVGLKEAVKYFEDAAFYPFNDLSNTLNHIVEVLLELDVDDPVVSELEAVARLVDDEVGQRYGHQEAGERLKQRAIQYFEKKRYLEALDAFHQLKHKWVSASSPKGVILAGIFIAECYKRLRMDYASRYYAFGVAQIVAKSDDVDLQKYLPKALLIAAEGCYTSGAWLSYVDALDLCVLSHTVATKDFELYDENKQNVGIVFHPAVILYITRRFNLTSQHLFAYRFGRWGYIGNEINDMLRELTPKFDEQTDQELYASLQEQLNDRIFNDLGPLRTISFEVYGSRWTVAFLNDFRSNAAGEQLVAIIQILMVELHDVEMYLIRSKIHIDFSIRDEIDMPKHQVFSSNDEIRWQVEFPTKPSDEFTQNSDVFYSALVISILQELSLLPVEPLMDAVHAKFAKQGLVGRLFFVAPFQALYHNFVSEDEFVESARSHFNDGEQFKPLTARENTKLPWKALIAPLYDRKASLQAIRNRMAFMQPYEITLPKLKQSADFRQVVQSLRDKGWLDWQIAMSVGNLIVNYKIQQVAPIYDPVVAKAKAFEFYHKPEKDWYIPIPESFLTVERIEQHMNMMLTMTVLPSFGLEFHSETPNTVATLELLDKRFNYRQDGKEIKVFD